MLQDHFNSFLVYDSYLVYKRWLSVLHNIVLRHKANKLRYQKRNDCLLSAGVNGNFNSHPGSLLQQFTTHHSLSSWYRVRNFSLLKNVLDNQLQHLLQKYGTPCESNALQVLQPSDPLLSGCFCCLYTIEKKEISHKSEYPVLYLDHNFCWLIVRSLYHLCLD